MSKDMEADRLIKRHVVWAMGGGLIPVPLFDIAAVTGIQMDMLRELADLYEADFSRATGKRFVSSLTGSTFARVGASLIKAVPGVGTIVGGLSMSVMSGASTYAVGQVAKGAFGSENSLGGVDLNWAKEEYDKAFDKGKEFVSQAKKTGSADAYESLAKLGKLRDDGVITEEEFEEQKRKLLERV
jgi:uncharacterized protein (DUF697 family)